jgi:hypothetical protein
MPLERRPFTSVVAAVGHVTDDVLAALARAVNVRVVQLEEPDPMIRAVRAWEQCRSSSRTFTVHDADPLSVVRQSWSDWFSGTAPHGTVEIARSDALARFRAGTVDLPDVYLVVGAADLAEHDRHWYLGVLHDAAPSRVIPTTTEPHAALKALTSWTSGRWWPTVESILDTIENRLPNRP